MVKKRTVGMTLVEVCVAFGILTIFCSGLYYLMAEAQRKNLVTQARAHAQKSARQTLAHLQRDFAQARLGSHKALNETAISFMIDTPVGIATISYSYAPPKLIRKEQKKTKTSEHVIADNLVKFLVVKKEMGQVIFEIETSVVMNGLRPDQAQHHAQNQLIMMRADNSLANDPNWRQMGNVNGMFMIEGDLGQSLVDDLKGYAEQEKKKLEEIKNTAEDGTVGKVDELKNKLNEIKTQLTSSFKNLDQQFTSINSQIGSIDAGGILSRTASTLFSDKDAAAKRIKDKLAGITKVGDMNWEAVKSTVSGWNVSEEFKQIFDAKQKIFDAGKDIFGTAKELGVSLDGVDPEKYGVKL